MINNPIFFYISAFSLILFTLLALFMRNVVYSLLCSIVVFFLGALLFYILGSEYNAIIQAAIYGFAVPIIIGISIMFTGNNKNKKNNYSLKYLSFLSMGVFILAFTYIVMIAIAMNPNIFATNDIVQLNTFDTIRVFARNIFINYVWAFEMVALLLTIVIVGLGLLRKKGI